MEYVLDPNNEEDAEILAYSSRATDLRRRQIGLGACVILILFIIVNALLYPLFQ